MPRCVGTRRLVGFATLALQAAASSCWCTGQGRGRADPFGIAHRAERPCRANLISRRLNVRRRNRSKPALSLPACSGRAGPRRCAARAGRLRCWSPDRRNNRRRRRRSGGGCRDRPMPPNGALDGAPLVGLFQLITPARTLAQNLSYSSGLPPIRLAARPKRVLFASSIAASKSLTRMICSTGPKISSSGRSLDIGHVDQRGGEIRPLLERAVEPAQRLAALHHQVEPLLLDMVGGGKVDHRAHERLRIGEGLVDDHPVDRASVIASSSSPSWPSSTISRRAAVQRWPAVR